jgi:hypothetical protein
MIAILLKFMLHFQIGGGGGPLSLLSLGAKIPSYATYPLTPWSRVLLENLTGSR